MHPDNSNPSTEFPPDNQRLPVSLQFIAYLVVLIGTLGLIDMLLLFIVRGGSIHIHFLWLPVFYIHILLLPAGLAMLRRREWARQMVSFFTAMAVFGCALALVGGSLYYVVLFATGDHLVKFVSSFSLSTTMVWSIALMAYLVWQYRVLHRLEVVELFQSARKMPQPIFPIRFSIANLLVMIVFASILMLQFADERKFYDSRSLRFSSSSSGNRTVHYGHVRSNFNRSQTLIYVVFEVNQETGQSVIISGASKPSGLEVTLHLPDAKEIDLLGEHRVFELNQDNIRRSDARITYDELQAFLADPDAERSLDGLLEFVEELRSAAP